MRLPDPALAVLARQHGVIGRHQLLAWLPASTIDTRRQRGDLVPVERGVYRVCGGAAVAEGAAMAAVLRARPGARLTGPFVLGLLDLDGFGRRDPFEVLTAPGRRLRGVRFRHRPDPTPDQPSATISHLPVVTATAALVDSALSAPTRDDRRLRVAVDQARRRGLTTPDRLLARARQLRAEPLLTWMGEDLLLCDSEEERVLGQVLARIDPRPEPQAPVLRYRVDWLWRVYRFGVEMQGGIDHLSSQARRADEQRRLAIADAGVRLCEVDGAELQRPDRLARRVHALLALRATELDLPAPSLRG